MIYKVFLKLLARAGGVFLGVVFLLATMAPSQARIRCEGAFQIIKGVGKHATPYCEDNYLARIARSYGWKVSNRDIRQNLNLKHRVCRHIGHDNRLVGICTTFDRGGFRGPR